MAGRCFSVYASAPQHAARLGGVPTDPGSPALVYYAHHGSKSTYSMKIAWGRWNAAHRDALDRNAPEYDYTGAPVTAQQVLRLLGGAKPLTLQELQGHPELGRLQPTLCKHELRERDSTATTKHVDVIRFIDDANGLLWKTIRTINAGADAEREEWCLGLDRPAGVVPAWVSGCMGAWMHGCMGAWMHGCMDAWMHGCMDAWMHGCMDAWMHGCMDG